VLGSSIYGRTPARKPAGIQNMELGKEKSITDGGHLIGLTVQSLYTYFTNRIFRITRNQFRIKFIYGKFWMALLSRIRYFFWFRLCLGKWFDHDWSEAHWWMWGFGRRWDRTRQLLNGAVFRAYGLLLYFLKDRLESRLHGQRYSPMRLPFAWVHGTIGKLAILLCV